MKMRFDDLQVDPDITRARTLPGALYHHPDAWQRQRNRVFPRCWHMLPHDGPRQPTDMVPWSLLPGCLDEPLLLTRDEGDALHVISNVCTHRGKVVIDRPCRGKSLRCGYHGRRFGLDGTCTSAPGFEDAVDFPGSEDHLSAVPHERWHDFVFASLDPAHPLSALLEPVVARTAHLPWDRAVFAPRYSRSFVVEANWALYCDNYLEGLHIPYVHPQLNRALDFESYRTELFDVASLQVGIAAPDELAFELPAGHPDHGQRVAGWSFFLFPTTMLNVYPWGVSVNIVLPMSPERTKVVFLRWIWDESRHERGAGAGLHEVEYEDEIVVESTARGVRARLYHRGRYAPRHERAVHHFHRLLAEHMRGA